MRWIAAVILALSATSAGAEVGRYAIADQAAAAVHVDAAIKKATADLPLFMRPFAERTLRDANGVNAELVVGSVVGADGRERIHLQLAGNPAVVTVAGLEGDVVTDHHGVARVRQWRDGPVTVQVAARKEGTRTIRCVPGEDGVVDLEVQFVSPQLPVPLRYRLRYRAMAPATTTAEMGSGGLEVGGDAPGQLDLASAPSSPSRQSTASPSSSSAP